MSEFSFPTSHRQAEIGKTLRRELTKERLFVLLLGPSATGKSTIIEELNRQASDTYFEYVKPIVTRPNRPNETDKISVADSEFDAMEASGKFVVVNGLYGVRYGTPLEGILSPLSRGNMPILDYPLETVSALQRPEYDTLNFYIYPPSLEAWRGRIESSGRNTDGRLEAGTQELGSLAVAGFSHPDIDVSIVNAEGAASVAANDILDAIQQVTA
jgi:ribose 1,5-bisphosphokinase